MAVAATGLLVNAQYWHRARCPLLQGAHSLKQGIAEQYLRALGRKVTKQYLSELMACYEVCCSSGSTRVTGDKERLCENNWKEDDKIPQRSEEHLSQTCKVSSSYKALSIKAKIILHCHVIWISFNEGFKIFNVCNKAQLNWSISLQK